MRGRGLDVWTTDVDAWTTRAKRGDEDRGCGRGCGDDECCRGCAEIRGDEGAAGAFVVTLNARANAWRSEAKRFGPTRAVYWEDGERNDGTDE